MLPSLLHMGFDNHYNCVDEHDYNQRMQILLPFETIRMIRCLGVLAMGALILVQHFFGDHSFDGETFLPKESFYNGEAAYLLNQSSATWGQNLSSENSLPNPCASDKYKVYKGVPDIPMMQARHITMSRMASVPMPDVIIMKNHITMKQIESTRSVMPDNYMPTQIMHRQFIQRVQGLQQIS